MKRNYGTLLPTLFSVMTIIITKCLLMFYSYFSKLQIRLYLNKLYVVRYLNYGTTKYRELDLTFKRKQLIGN